MQISVKNTAADILINTIILAHNRRSPNNVEFVRCYKCGTGLNQVKGIVGAIYAGYVPSDDVATITRCHNCQENYTFQTQYNIGITWTKLVLSAAKPLTTFHCIICRHQLLQYNGLGAVLLPEFKKVVLPAPFACFNNVCKSRYLLQDIVEAEVI